MTNISQEMTQIQSGGVPLAFPALMTFKSPKAVVNVLPIMKCPGCIASSLCHSLVPAHTHTHRDTGAGLLLRRNKPRPLISEGLSSICPCTVYTSVFTLTNDESLEGLEVKNDRT